MVQMLCQAMVANGLMEMGMGMAIIQKDCNLMLVLGNQELQ
jgi:hypothetical protein